MPKEYKPTDYDFMMEEVFTAYSKVAHNPAPLETFRYYEESIVDDFIIHGIIKPNSTKPFFYDPGPTFHTIFNDGGWIGRERKLWEAKQLNDSFINLNDHQKITLWIAVGVSIITLSTSILQCNISRDDQEYRKKELINQAYQDSIQALRFDSAESRFLRKTDELLELLKRKDTTEASSQ